MPIHQFKRIEIGFLIFFNGIENICKIKPKVAFSSVKFPLHHTADSCLKGNFVEGHINWGANMWIKLEFIFVHIIFDRQGLPYRFIFFLYLKGLFVLYILLMLPHFSRLQWHKSVILVPIHCNYGIDGKIIKFFWTVDAVKKS